MKRSLAYFVTRLRKNFEAYCGTRLQEIGLSQGLLFFILYIGKHPGCSPTQMGEALKMDSGHVARSLVKLERAGFISQEQNPRDRRSHTLCLTKQGEEAFSLSHDLFDQWDLEVVGPLSEQERAALLSILERLTPDTEV